MNVLNRRVAVALMGALASLVVLAPVAQATTNSECTGVVGPLRQCESDVRGEYNGPSPHEYAIGSPAFAYTG